MSGGVVLGFLVLSVYAYAFGELMVLSLYARYQEEGEAFVDKYFDLLGPYVF